MRGQHWWRAGIRAPARTAAISAALAAVLALAGPAYPQLWTGAGSDDDLRYRLGVIDAELADIRARLGEAPPAAGGGGASGAGSDVMLRLDRLEAEIRKLTGRIEQMDFEQRGVAEDAARRFGDIEFRLTELEGGDISILAPVLPLGGGGTVVAAGPEVSISERGDLDRAIEDVRQGRFDQGEDRLRSFLTAYPRSPLKGEALYWLGESQFVRGAFQNAALSYLNGYKIDPAGAAAPKNLYRLGVTLGRLGQLDASCLTLRDVRNQFPAGPVDVLDAADAESSALNCG
ncbi:MAG: tetratricopeptide repeat protein [Proteobacteria bacterium]|nr:tetratricopeptide repeat protein [Pseudomonadota bacterium]